LSDLFLERGAAWVITVTMKRLRECPRKPKASMLKLAFIFALMLFFHNVPAFFLVGVSMVAEGAAKGCAFTF
jgi:hypothetical protein